MNAKGDMFYWANTFTPHHFENSNGWYNSVDFYNENPAPKGPFKEDRDYHLQPKPGYSVFVYPHPLQGLLADLTCETDLTGDNQTNAADLEKFVEIFNAACDSPCPADFDFNDTLDLNDFLLLENKMGTLCKTSPNKQIKNKIFIFPNPAAESLNFKLSDSRGQNVKVELLDMSGRLILKVKTKADPYSPAQIDLTTVDQGVYVLKVTSGGTVFLKRFTKIEVE